MEVDAAPLGPTTSVFSGLSTHVLRVQVRSSEAQPLFLADVQKDTTPGMVLAVCICVTWRSDVNVCSFSQLIELVARMQSVAFDARPRRAQTCLSEFL